MEVLNYTEARASLKDVMDRVVDNHEEVVVTRRNGGSVVMVSLDDWNSVQETFRLLSSPRNAERLRASIKQMNEGRGVEHELVER